MKKKQRFLSIFLALILVMGTGIFACISVTAAPQGDGNVETPYLISSKEDLEWLSNEVQSGNSFENCYFSQTADIDLGGAEFRPIGSVYSNVDESLTIAFSGFYDGNNHTISNAIISSVIPETKVSGHAPIANTEDTECTYYPAALFGVVSNGSVRNLNVDNIKAGTYDDTQKEVGKMFSVNLAAGVVGYLNNGVVYGCNTGSNVEVYGSWVAGGVVGYATIGSKIQCSVNNAKLVVADRIVGGVVGAGYGITVTYCVNNGAIVLNSIDNTCIADVCAGGVLGRFSYVQGDVNTISYCLNSEKASITCYFYSGDDTRRQNVGGICGFEGDPLDTYNFVRCYNLMTTFLMKDYNTNLADKDKNGYTHLTGAIIGQVSASGSNAANMSGCMSVTATRTIEVYDTNGTLYDNYIKDQDLIMNSTYPVAGLTNGRGDAGSTKYIVESGVANLYGAEASKIKENEDYTVLMDPKTAIFVDVKYIGCQETTAENGTFKVRFVGGAETDKHDEYGFKISMVVNEKTTDRSGKATSFPTKIAGGKVKYLSKHYMSVGFVPVVVDNVPASGQVDFYVNIYFIDGNKTIDGPVYHTRYIDGKFKAQARDGVIIDIPEGDGTETNPFKITNAVELGWLAQEVNKGNSFSGCNFVQTADIDLGGTTFTPIGAKYNVGLTSTIAFSGTYDGQGYSISNATIKALKPTALEANSPLNNSSPDEIYPVGIFGAVVNGTIKNLKAKNIIAGVSNIAEDKNPIIKATNYKVTIPTTTTVNANDITNPVKVYKEGVFQIANWYTSSYAGVICGIADAATIENCSTDTKCQANGAWGAGGIVGFIVNTADNSFTTVTKCENNAYVTSDIYVGGIIGATWSSSNVISYCLNQGTVILMNSYNSYKYAGGIIGNMGKGSTISYCINGSDAFLGAFSTRPSGDRRAYVAGMCGGADSRMKYEHCYNLMTTATLITYRDASNNNYLGAIISQVGGKGEDRVVFNDVASVNLAYNWSYYSGSNAGTCNYSEITVRDTRDANLGKTYQYAGLCNGNGDAGTDTYINATDAYYGKTASEIQALAGYQAIMTALGK